MRFQLSRSWPPATRQNAMPERVRSVGITVSPFFLGMLPYLFTIAAIVFAALVGGRRLGAPAALGLPYRREER